ncbi:hypothetical protein HanOQP8_Chr16g0616911 [Helianthus annuus]|nr:hypothetical protein HanOQP8_Chr16g0616911 [Helianthus annuus]
MSSRAVPLVKKRKYKGRNSPGLERATINWKEEEFQNLVRYMGFLPEWGAQFPTPNSTAIDAPLGYISLYAAFFWEGNFCLPMTKFTADVLRNYGLHISQLNALRVPHVTHFEFICRANRVEPTFEMFNVFYMVTYTGGFYSFNSRTSGVIPCSSNPPKSLHDWKQKFFYIRRGVIPVDMHYRAEGEGIPKVDVAVDFAQQEWYKKVTHKATSISQLEERALVGAGMSMLWVPKNPLGVPVYGYQGKLGYSLLNVLDPRVSGAMVETIQAEGKPTWLDQIRNRFLHPTSESFAAYANTVLGEDSGDGFDDTIDPTREEVIVLSSEGSDGSHDCLTPHSPRADPAQGATAEQLETRRKNKLDKSEEKEKKAEENVTEAPHKRPSTLSFLDYVVVSDTLSGLGVGSKRTKRDPEDDETLTEIMKKRKTLEDKKKELHEQAATALAAKKSKLQKETPPAPSESEIDMGVFSAKRGNLLEKIYIASTPQGVKSGKTFRKIDISKIMPPASPPSRAFDLSTPRDDLGGKEEQGNVEVKHVGEGGAADAGGAGGAGGAGDGGDGVQGKGVDSEAESSEATPHQTIYTRRPSGFGGGATFGVPRSHEIENIQAGS